MTATRIAGSRDLQYVSLVRCVLVALVCTASCVPTNLPSALVRATPEPAHVAALTSFSGSSDAPAGPITVPRAWRWHPARDVELWIWAVCRGESDARACRIVVARPTAPGRLTLLVDSPIGWALPLVIDGPDREQMIVEGDDGRGEWRQILHYERVGTHDAVSLTRRLYTDTY